MTAKKVATEKEKKEFLEDFFKIRLKNPDLKIIEIINIKLKEKHKNLSVRTKLNLVRLNGLNKRNYKKNDKKQQQKQREDEYLSFSNLFKQNLNLHGILQMKSKIK